MSRDKTLRALWSAAQCWLDGDEPEAGGFAGLLDVARECAPPHDWTRLERLPLESDAAHLELWLLEELQAEDDETKAQCLWFRVRTSEWKGRIDGGELALERLLSEPRRPPASEFSEPLRAERESIISPASLGVLLHEAGRMRAERHGELLEELLLGPLAISAIAWSVQTTLERIPSPILLGDYADREILVGYDGGPGLSLGRCGRDSWYRDAVTRFG